MAFSPETYAILKGKIKQLEEEIAALTGPTDWLGVTTTPITDGSTVNPIVVNGKIVSAKDGSITSYNGIEFVFTGDIWQEFGRDSSDFVTKAGLLQIQGNATDNTMSQKAISDALSNKLSRTNDLANTVENSDKVIKGSGVYSALQQKQDTLTFDNYPSENSNNPVKSGGLYMAFNRLFEELIVDFQHKIYRDVYKQIIQPVETITYNNHSYRMTNANIANKYILTLLSDTDEMTMILRDNGEVHNFNSIYYEHSDELDRYCLFLGKDLSEEETILNPDALFLFSEDESSAQLYLGNTISANRFFSYDIYRIDGYELPALIPVDVEPEEYSGNLITSGAVYNEIKNTNFVVHEIYDSTLKIDRLDKRWGDIADAFEFGKVCFCGSWDSNSKTGGYSLISWIANLNGKYGIWTTGSPSTDDPDYWCDNESDYPYIHE